MPMHPNIARFAILRRWPRRDAMHRLRSTVTWAGMLGLVTLSLEGCASSSALHREEPSPEIGVLYARDTEHGSPCRDSLFLALRSQPPDSLSQGQLRYMLGKERECADYQKQQARHEGSPFLGGVLLGFVVGGILGAAAVGAAFAGSSW